jgi:threonine synthase
MQMHDLPDPRGHFGPYGGVFVAETLSHALEELLAAYKAAQQDPAFAAEFRHDLKHYVGRPSPVYHARRWSQMLGGAQIYLKREDLNHTGAHKINNTIGQALLARRMGKPRIIAETGAGMHGVAAATVAARYGMQCVVYMGAQDIKRQVQNVYRMRLLGASVVAVESGSKTLKDALNEAMRDWVTNVDSTFYIIGTVAGPRESETLRTSYLFLALFLGAEHDQEMYFFVTHSSYRNYLSPRLDHQPRLRSNLAGWVLRVRGLLRIGGADLGPFFSGREGLCYRKKRTHQGLRQSLCHRAHRVS